GIWALRVRDIRQACVVIGLITWADALFHDARNTLIRSMAKVQGGTVAIVFSANTL
ncbi:hypothetical protein H4S04_005951, partial [Coemansia sp. S16]